MLLHAEDLAEGAFHLTVAEQGTEALGGVDPILHTALCLRCEAPLGVAWCVVGEAAPSDGTLRIHKDRVALGDATTAEANALAR